LYTFVHSSVIYAVEMFIWNGLRCTVTHRHFYMIQK